MEAGIIAAGFKICDCLIELGFEIDKSYFKECFGRKNVSIKLYDFIERYRKYNEK